ncbi:hypothetical protein TSUD_379670 [Trifolium subterraneum]|nr:hypothetical protein TSUD_379670 [Trifolium subterraneum]
MFDAKPFIDLALPPPRGVFPPPCDIFPLPRGIPFPSPLSPLLGPPSNAISFIVSFLALPPPRGPLPPLQDIPFPPLLGPPVVQGSPKTELCKFWQNNPSCPHTVCKFAHGEHERCQVKYHESYQTKLCRNFFSEHGCDYGTRCHFMH